MIIDGIRPHVSVIIPTLNEASSIETVVRRLLTGISSTTVEVIVADGRSTDATRERVAGLAVADPRIRLVDNPDRVTPAALNAAIAASHGDVILRMDGHAEPEPGYVDACLSVLAASGAWCVGGTMRKVGTTRAARGAAAATSSPFGIGGGRRFHLQDEPADLDSVWLGCWPRWVFERIGLFDPEMIRNQDDEFSQRILDAGGRIRFDPSISAAYISRASWRGLVRQYFGYGLFKVRAVQKRPRLLRFRHLAPAALVGSLVTTGILSVTTPWALVVVGAISVAWLVVAARFARNVADEFEAGVVDVVRAFACLHAGYGAGMWVGLIRFAPRWFIDRTGNVPRLEAIAD